jgi:AraC family transcriptional regulator
MPTARFRDSAVEVLTLPPVRVAALEHNGDSAAFGEALDRLIAWRQAEGLHPRQHPTYNILYPSPESASQEQGPVEQDLLTLDDVVVDQATEIFRLDVCVTLYGQMPENDLGLVSKVIAGGRYAVMRVNNDRTALQDALTFLRQDWLSRHGETLREAPVILHRIGVGADDPAVASLVDLQLPLE